MDPLMELIQMKLLTLCAFSEASVYTINDIKSDESQMVVDGGTWKDPSVQDYLGNTVGNADGSYPKERMWDGDDSTYTLSEIGGQLVTTAAITGQVHIVRVYSLPINR